MTRKAVVVGAGIVGCSVALELARRGYQVRVVERNEEVGHGSTALSSSVVRCHYGKPEAVRLAREGRAVWEDWERHVGMTNVRARYERTGALLIFREGEGTGA